MDWDEYKRRCDTPGVLSRWMLERTAEVVDPVVAEHLLAATSGKPLPKPGGHKGGSDTDMFELHLNDAVADAVLAGVERAQAAGNQKMRGFVAAWREYRDAVSADLHGSTHPPMDGTPTLPYAPTVGKAPPAERS